jgi:hypothetical protein
MNRKIFGTIYIISFIIFPLLVLSPAINLPASIPLRLAVFCLLTIGGVYIFRRTWPQYSWGMAFLVTALGYGATYKLASFLPDISSYPFSLGWSEGSRYYYASLWLSRQVYGVSVPPSVLHPTRYLLQAFPFLIPGASLWLDRFWQVVLWVVTTGLTSWVLVRRLALTGRNKPLVISLCMILWGFIFLFQGPVYYHLQIIVIVILLGFDRHHFWRSLILVSIASLWAGLSRVNWLPVPGLLAAALYLMEDRVEGKPIIKYLVPPAVWVLAGTVLGYASQSAYQLWSGNPQSWFGSSFTSDLLWYRLFPNPTYPLGILLSAFLVSLPIIGLIIVRLIKRWREYHPIRLLGLATILVVLFAGGVLVSVKIGGGSNLHNLDAYLTLLLVIGSYIYFDRFVPDHPAHLADDGQAQPVIASSNLLRTSENIFLAGALIIPIYFTLSMGGQLPRRDFAAAEAALQKINTATQQVAGQGGEVLFISQRHLLTFDEVQNVPLVPENELVFLMEMAMSDNQSYMDAFNNAISTQRYSMIVSEPLVIQHQGRSHSFGEENDAWVQRVSEPVLCYYQPAENLDAVGVVLYTPRPTLASELPFCSCTGCARTTWSI